MNDEERKEKFQEYPDFTFYMMITLLHLHSCNVEENEG